MSDLIERLRARAIYIEQGGAPAGTVTVAFMCEAADELDRLRAEVAELKAQVERDYEHYKSAMLMNEKYRRLWVEAEQKLATARRDGREEAAKVADEFWEGSVHDPRKKIHGKTAADIAVAIRALSTAPAPSGGYLGPTQAEAIYRSLSKLRGSPAPAPESGPLKLSDVNVSRSHFMLNEWEGADDAPAPTVVVGEEEITRAIMEAFHMEGDCLVLTEETRPMYARQAARNVLAHINKGGM